MNIRNFTAAGPVPLQDVIGALTAIVSVFVPILLAIVGSNAGGDTAHPEAAPAPTSIVADTTTVEAAGSSRANETAPSATVAHQATSHANTPVATISQGTRIALTANTSCTIGYVDAATHTAYTAAHCFTRTGQTTAHIRQGRTLVPIGTAHVSADSVDIAVIELNDNVAVGDNAYSGDTTLGREHVRADDKICSYGSTSKRSDCMGVFALGDTELYSTAQARVEGDSGGPVWLTDAAGNVKGLIGIHSGYMRSSHLPSPADRAALIDAASWGADTRAIAAPNTPAPANDNPPATISVVTAAH